MQHPIYNFRMLKKVIEYQKARLLRQGGKSLKEISDILGVAKSSVSLWCKKITLSNDRIIQLRSRKNAPKNGAQANRTKRQKELALIREEAQLEVVPFTADQLDRLKDIGTIIYWAEGTKKRLVDITNSDPYIIRLAMRWFREICHVPESKFRISVFYHYNHDEEKLRDYWSRLTGVPLTQFHKSIFKQEGTGHRKNRHEFGTCKVRICDKNLLHRILTWVGQFHLE